jgi:membrane protease YdiL (CAAX protease family)
VTPADGLSARRTRGFALGAVIAWAIGAVATQRVGLWLGMGATALALGALALVVDRGLTKRLRPSLKIVGASVLCGALMAVAAWTLYPVVANLFPGVTGDKMSLYGAFATMPRAQAALLLPLIIGGEELVWRGAVQETLWRHASKTRGILLGAIVYGLATLPCGSPLLASAAFACGLAWSCLRLATGSVLAPMICHLTWAVLVLFVRPVKLG